MIMAGSGVWHIAGIVFRYREDVNGFKNVLAILWVKSTIFNNFY